MAPVRRCNCKKKRPIPFLPPRPRRPGNGFSLFFREYYNEEYHKSNYCWKERGELMADAGNWWWKAPEACRNFYREKARQNLERYCQQLDIWKQKRKKLKRPMNAYIQFHTHQIIYLKRENQQKSLSQTAKHVSKAWKEMTLSVRNEYKKCYAKRKAAYDQRIRDLKDGKTTLDELIRK